MPNSANTAAANSRNEVTDRLSGWLLKRMPGTASCTMAWSPVHALRLSVISSAVT
jgi:hypothetical protein